MVVGYILSKVAPNSALSQNIFPPASKFDPKRDIPDLSGQIYLVTGGNTGIGYGTVQHLLEHNAKVYLAARSQARADTAIAQLKKATGKTAIFLQLDLSDLSSVRKAAETYMSLQGRLDVLILNAGIMGTAKNVVTPQGYDAHFGVNVLGHYFFTSLLMSTLSESTKQFGKKARVLSYSSALMSTAPGKTGIEWDSLEGGEKRDAITKNISEFELYGQSKLGNALSTKIFHEMDPTVAFCTIHPGVLRSELSRDFALPVRIVSYLIAYPVSYGPLTALYAATVVPEEQMDGAYFIPWARVGKLDPRAENLDTVDKLKTWLDAAIAGF